MNETIEKKATPQDRLAAALEAVSPIAGLHDESVRFARDILAADPTIAADLTLAWRVRNGSITAQEIGAPEGSKWVRIPTDFLICSPQDAADLNDAPMLRAALRALIPLVPVGREGGPEWMRRDWRKKHDAVEAARALTEGSGE